MNNASQHQINAIDALINLGADYPDDFVYESYKEAEKYINRWSKLKNKVKNSQVRYKRDFESDY